MPYTTAVPNAVIDLEATTPVVQLPPTFVLNFSDLSPSAEFDRYDVEANSATTLDRGDTLSLVDEEGTTVDSGTFAGTGQLTTARVTTNVGLLGSIGVRLNPVDVGFYVDEADQAFMLSDIPLSQDRLSVVVDFSLVGINLSPVVVPLNDIGGTLAGIPALGAVLGPVTTAVTNLAQQTLNTAVLNLNYNPNGTLPLDDAEVVPCFLRGTMILTTDGLVAVEDLSVGTLVVTRDNATQPVRWVGHVALPAERLRAQPNLRPIRIAPGALGANLPAQALLVSPQHRILVRSAIAQRMFGAPEVLVAAKQLLPLEGIDIADDLETVEYFHILFDRHEIVFANGTETESLYTGPQALRGVGHAARAEIFALFPELERPTSLPPSARELASGRMARKLAMRHLQNGKPLVGMH
ncbi:Hint domain-containing protein [Paracoccus aerius]|uniref:Hint domain-containing protein n=1 Tax=Paracoccus aerius TaxID=1915382 RepID=A0ABS1S724_9RHOB|nr:Hint domain-containing protein [Paracoccus aerius]MBL3674370.1 Hint domain-containing protein [Paracoccus aerius]GHG25130.1 hemolysin [Paracoccus aerius]